LSQTQGHGDPSFSRVAQRPTTFLSGMNGTAKPLTPLKHNYGIQRDGTPLPVDLTTDAPQWEEWKSRHAKLDERARQAAENKTGWEPQLYKQATPG
jgi:hypothetical protein